MSSVKVVAVDWFDQNSDEAVVTIADTEHAVRCFAHPVQASVGDMVRSRLFTVGAEHVARTAEPCGFRDPNGDLEWDMEFVGVVVSRLPMTVCVGDIFIEVDAPLPKDIMTGDRVHVVVERIDYVT